MLKRVEDTKELGLRFYRRDMNLVQIVPICDPSLANNPDLSSQLGYSVAFSKIMSCGIVWSTGVTNLKEKSAQCYVLNRRHWQIA